MSASRVARTTTAVVVLLAAAAVVVLPNLVVPEEAHEVPAPAGVSRSDDWARWQPPDPMGDDWQAQPGKVPSLQFVPRQGGLWDLEVPQDAGGELRTVPGEVPEPNGDTDQVTTVRVEVEAGLGVDGPEFARQVMATLNDPRGWGHDGSVSFARTAGRADVDITLASPTTTDRLCAPVDTGGTVSCGRVGFAVLNAVRWADGAQPFLDAGGTVAGYRQYLVNHEVGHVLGYPHVSCPGPGEVAPVMVQQTLGLDGCEPNGWPADAP